MFSKRLSRNSMNVDDYINIDYKVGRLLSYLTIANNNQ